MPHDIVVEVAVNDQKQLTNLIERLSKINGITSIVVSMKPDVL